MPRVRILSVALGLAAASLCAAAPWSSAHSVPPAPPHLIITDSHARPLPENPRLSPGEVVIVQVRGFAADAPVQVRLVGGALVARQPHAARNGSLHFAYRVPATLLPGAHLLAFSGRGPARPVTNRSAATTIVATVPNIGLVHFRVRAHQ